MSERDTTNLFGEQARHSLRVLNANLPCSIYYIYIYINKCSSHFVLGMPYVMLAELGVGYF